MEALMATEIPFTTSALPRPTAWMSPLSQLAKKIDPTLAEWIRRRQYRADLKRLLKVGPHMINDIGLPLHEAHREIGKPFWRA